MHTSQRISKFYDDLEKLGLKFPGKELSNKLKVSKGYVSDVLNKKKEPSDEFLNEFYKMFTIQFTNGSLNNNSMDNYELPVGSLRVTLKDYVDLLKEQTRKAEEEKDRLFRLLEKQLSELKSSSEEIVEDLAALTIEVQAEHRAIMDTVDKAAKQTIGTTAATADKIEIASQQERLSKGKHASVGKQG